MEFELSKGQTHTADICSHYSPDDESAWTW
jgi:hypothetical protein